MFFYYDQLTGLTALDQAVLQLDPAQEAVKRLAEAEAVQEELRAELAARYGLQ